MFHDPIQASDDHIAIRVDPVGDGNSIFIYRTSRIALKHMSGEYIRPLQDFFVVTGFKNLVDALLFATSDELATSAEVMWGLK